MAADRDPAAPGFALADRRALVSAEDEQGVARLAAGEQVDGLIAPGIDWPVAVAARVAAQLGLPHPLTPAAALLATSKVRQRERFAEVGVPQPRWALVHSLAELQGLAVGPPCVVKAPDRQGQRGLSLVPLKAPANALEAAVETAIAASRSGAALLEELAPGSEVTVNAFSAGGIFHALTVTDRLTADPPAFGVALAHAWPARDGGEAAASVARAAVEALGIGEGPTYTQLRLGPDGAQVIEVAARLGGGHDAELCEAALGVDLNGLALAAALGRRVSAGELAGSPRVGGACVHFLVAPPGELRAVEGVEDARALPGVHDVRIYQSPGQRIGPLRLGADRAGALLAVGDSRDDALARADEAASRIRFRTVWSRTDRDGSLGRGD